MTDEAIAFDDLALNFGQQLMLHPNPADKTMVFGCVLAGCLIGESLMVTVEPNGVFPRLEEGQRVAIRVFLDSGVALFMTTVLFIGEVPTLLIYLDLPAQVKFKRLRAAKRVVVAQPILINNIDNTAFMGVAGKLMDVSTGGGRVQMFDQLGDVGDAVELKGKFQIHGITRLLTVRACIRKKEDDDYGIQFVEDDEDKLIILMGFIFNAMLTGEVDAIR